VVTHLEDEILPFNVPTFAKAEPEGCRQLRTGRGRGGEPADSIDLSHLLLPLRGKRRKSEADSENDREPDPPHGHPRWWTAGGESSRPELVAACGLPRPADDRPARAHHPDAIAPRHRRPGRRFLLAVMLHDAASEELPRMKSHPPQDAVVEDVHGLLPTPLGPEIERF